VKNGYKQSFVLPGTGSRSRRQKITMTMMMMMKMMKKIDDWDLKKWPTQVAILRLQLC